MNRKAPLLGRFAIDWREVSGGANRDRTGDLLLAKQALSQLSYGPWGLLAFSESCSGFAPHRSLVGGSGWT